MSKERIITLVVVGGLLAFAVVRRKSGGPGGAPAEPSPQDTIYRMLDAARAGDVKAYLAQYTGPLEETLLRTVTADYLKTSNGEIKGVAVSDLQPATATDAQIRLEYIYQDRNEVQTVFLQKLDGRWKITRVDSAERIKTLVPYGTPVAE
jgi:hypothetical protein